MKLINNFRIILKPPWFDVVQRGRIFRGFATHNLGNQGKMLLQAGPRQPLASLNFLHLRIRAHSAFYFRPSLLLYGLLLNIIAQLEVKEHRLSIILLNR